MNLAIKDILTVLPGNPFTVRRCDVYVSGDVIASVGEAPAGFVPDETLSGEDRLLIPGLVNCHTHCYMTLFRNSADDLAFSDWLFGRIMPMEDQLQGDDCYWTSLLGCMEMLASGTTCFLDMHLFPHRTARAVDESGIRAVLSRGLQGSREDPEGGERRFRQAFEEIDRWKGHPRLGFMLGPHAPYTCDDWYLEKVADVAEEKGLGVHIHLAESLTEIDTIQKRYGCSPVALAERTGLFRNRTVAAHCVHLDENDMDILKKHDVTVASNPISNLKLANGVAPIPQLLKKGVNVALGTDGSASNNALNMFREMGAAALLHKGLSGNPELVSARDCLKMATENGAKALGLNAGRIEVGRKADLAILRLTAPHMRPENDVIASLAYSANGSEVETVIVDGEIVYKNGEFPKIDTERVYAEVARISARIGTRPKED